MSGLVSRVQIFTPNMGLIDDLPSLGCLVDVLPKEQRLTCLEFSSLSPTCMPNIFVRARFTGKKQANQPKKSS